MLDTTDSLIVVGNQAVITKQMLLSINPDATKHIQLGHINQLHSDKQLAMNKTLAILLANNNTILINGKPSANTREAIQEVNGIFPNNPVQDAAIASLQWQLQDLQHIVAPHQASLQWLKQMTRLMTITRRAPHLSVQQQDATTLSITPANRRGERFTLTFDETNPERITLQTQGNTAPLRKSVIHLQGHFLSAYLPSLILTPSQMVDLLLRRLVIQKPEELLSYGRALAPDNTKGHSFLDDAALNFRTEALTGVISLHTDKTEAARPNQIAEAAKACLRAGILVLPHQQGKELYTGPAILNAFRGTHNPDTNEITLGAKSTKHAKVDIGAFSLHTVDGTGLITVPAVIGAFDCSNDGSIYMPNALMDEHLNGFLYERVELQRDHENLTPVLIAKYYQAQALVQEGERIKPGQPVLQLGRTENTVPTLWNSTASYGIVEQVIIQKESKFIRIEILIRAHFEGEAKMRGPGKGLICSSEGASIYCSINTKGTEFQGLFFGANGVIKDSNAFNHYAKNQKKTIATVTQQMTPEALQAKRELYGALGTDKVRKPNGITITFNDDDQTMTIRDPSAIRCDLSFKIESSPVQQSVGKSSMVMPQMAVTSSQIGGNEWLSRSLPRRMTERINTIAYLMEVAVPAG